MVFQPIVSASMILLFIIRLRYQLVFGEDGTLDLLFSKIHIFNSICWPDSTFHP